MAHAAGTLERGETEYLKVNLSYDDVKQVPRDHARYISWKLHVRPVNINATSKTEIVGPFCKYYQQRDVDFSYEIATHTPLTQVWSFALMLGSCRCLGPGRMSSVCLTGY